MNCPTSKRTGVGLCGEAFTVGNVTHSCKYTDDHEGPHWCNCCEGKRIAYVVFKRREGIELDLDEYQNDPDSDYE